MGVLDVRGVVKIYPGHGSDDEPVKALADVSFTVRENEFCSILGHSGCGKTTLLNIMAGFDSATLGTLTLDGRPVGKPGWERAMIFQDYALFPWLTVLGNVRFGLEMKRLPAAERDEIAKRQIALVGLSGFEHRYPHQLSGGMRQRVAIARALAVDPSVLLMDEPFAALDAITRDLLHDELTLIWEETGLTVLFVTHNVREAVRLGQRVLLMSSRPGRFIRQWQVQIAGTRRIDSPAVADLASQITDDLREEIRRHAK